MVLATVLVGGVTRWRTFTSTIAITTAAATAPAQIHLKFHHPCGVFFLLHAGSPKSWFPAPDAAPLRNNWQQRIQHVIDLLLLIFFLVSHFLPFQQDCQFLFNLLARPEQAAYAPTPRVSSSPRQFPPSSIRSRWRVPASGPDLPASPQSAVAVAAVFAALQAARPLWESVRKRFHQIKTWPLASAQ